MFSGLGKECIGNKRVNCLVNLYLEKLSAVRQRQKLRGLCGKQWQYFDVDSTKQIITDVWFEQFKK